MKVAWFGHKAKERGDGLITYSKEIIRGLEARGAEAIFFYHGHRAEEDPKSVRLGSFNIFNHDLVSAPGAKEIIDEVLGRERVDVAHASLSFSLLDFSLPDICHDQPVLPALAMADQGHQCFAPCASRRDTLRTARAGQRASLSWPPCIFLMAAASPFREEMIRHRGKLPPRPESKLRLPLRLLVDYPEFRHRLGEEARKRVVERYSLCGNISRLMELYRRLIGRAA